MVSKGILTVIIVTLITIIGVSINLRQQLSVRDSLILTTSTENQTTEETIIPKPTFSSTNTLEDLNEVVDGEALYIQNCAGCHGSERVGGFGPALTEKNVDRNIIENGISDVGMPVFKRILTPEEISAIIDYIRS